MEKTSETIERRRQSVARQYRRQGYRVMIPERDPAARLPTFLGEHVPDLIAVSDDDRVIVEIKSVKALPGANDLVDLARRVDEEPGWRLELVTLAAQQETKLATPASMADLRGEIAALLHASFETPAFLCAWAGIEDLLRGAAMHHGLHPDNLSLPRLARELVTQGLMSADLYEEIRTEFAARNQTAHSHDVQVGRAVVERMMGLAERLYEDLALEPA